MSYKLEFIQSPNFTPASQSTAIYGRKRTIDFGAGHWWGDPNAGYSHQGVINTFLNKARQASAHAVVSAGRVTEMVRQEDIAWATNSANPFTVAIEVDPRMHLGGQLANEIKETLCEYIADKRWHNLQWLPHNHWKATQCNPLPWGEVMQRSRQIRAAKDAPPPPAVPEWRKNLREISIPTMYAIDGQTPLRSLSMPSQVIKNFEAGTPFEIAAETWVGGHRYLLTKYAYENGTGQGFDEYELKFADPIPEKPEWQRNLTAIELVKLMVMVPETGIYNLNDGSHIKNLAKGTWVDFKARTTVGGVEYLISSYSVENAMPNGIRRADMGVPVEPPSEKPEWLKNWRDIEDVTMYTRLNAPLVNLLTGETIKLIPVNTPVLIKSATVWHGQDYLMAEGATNSTADPVGIALSDLDIKQVEEPEKPEEPAPEQPPINDQLELLKVIVSILQAIAKFLGIKV